MSSEKPGGASSHMPNADDMPETVPQERFSPEEEAVSLLSIYQFHNPRANETCQALLSESNEQKIQANKLFTSSHYSEAIGEYDKALASCPNYLEYEIAVLKSNISACHLQLEDWKAAIESATDAIEALDRLEPIIRPTEKKVDGEEDGGIVEIEGDEEEAEKALAELKLSDERKESIRRIRAKSLLRRAKAKVELGGWGNLAGAEEGQGSLLLHSWTKVAEDPTDYKELSKMSNLPPRDQKTVQKALSSLPSQVNAAKDLEMGEMIGKLKEVRILQSYG